MFWTNKLPQPELRFFPTTDEVLVFDSTWNETHLVSGAVALIIESLRAGPRTISEIATAIAEEKPDMGLVAEWLSRLETLNLVVRSNE